MIYLGRAATEIMTVGLYDLILQNIHKAIGKEKPDENDVLNTLRTHPHFLQEYKEVNLENNLSNIHLKGIETARLTGEARTQAEEINKNLAILRDTEKYTIDFENSPTLVFIFSIEFFVLFSAQYFIVLLGLKTWQWEIYGFFALSILVAWIYAKKEKKRYATKRALFDALYARTLELIQALKTQGIVDLENSAPSAAS